MSTPRQLSIFDLKQIPGAIGIIQRNHKEEIDHLLHDLGFDVKHGYTYEECLHRPLTWKTNEPQLGVRIIGVERRDSDWINSEHSSWEAKLDACEDDEFRGELIEMGKQGSKLPNQSYSSFEYKEE